ncbi:MAG: hypothetical protein H7Y18_18160 [Clostridiaceae bacterium]|nr:hypothetical protein [Clostridiaceae bacterium]
MLQISVGCSKVNELLSPDITGWIVIMLKKTRLRNIYTVGGLRVRGDITFSSTIGKKLLIIIKDSFGNAFTPFLIPHCSLSSSNLPPHYKNLSTIIHPKGN